MPRVVLVDDHQLFRSGVRAELEGEGLGGRLERPLGGGVGAVAGLDPVGRQRVDHHHLAAAALLGAMASTGAELEVVAAEAEKALDPKVSQLSND